MNEDTRNVKFFDLQTGEILEEYQIAEGTGNYVRQSHPGSDRYSKHSELKKRVLLGFGEAEKARMFIETMFLDKPRYTRDQLSVIAKLQQRYTAEELSVAIAYCMERNLCVASDFKDTLEYFASYQEPD